MLRQNGFTLVELAIALMVIGLLIGGVLKGQELIQNAQYNKILRDHNGYKTAVAIFESTYSAFPGDMRNASTRLPNCAHCIGNSSHNGDGIIGHFVDILVDVPSIGSSGTHTAPSNTREGTNFWYHLEAAGLIKRVTMQANGLIPSPLTGIGYYVNGYRRVAVGNPITPGNYLLVFNNSPLNNNMANSLTPRIAEFLDSKIDDGKPLSGSVRAMGAYDYNNGNKLSSHCVIDGENTYNMPSDRKACHLALSLQY